MDVYKLFERYADTVPTGQVEWIGVRPARQQPLVALRAVDAEATLGLHGDHRMDKTPGSGRQVTLISREFIAQIEASVGRPIDPAELRRNVVVSGVNLNALRYQRVQIGEAIFEVGALCDPCERMEKTLGPGGFVSMMGYGGYCCKIVQSGRISVGDTVQLLARQPKLI
jgi:MOSC domain-containing protein YiiM